MANASPILINCATCNEVIEDGKQNSIACDVCGKWYHAKKICSMKRDIFKSIKDDSEFLWACRVCVQKMVNLQETNDDIPYEVLKQEVKEVRLVHLNLKTELDKAREQLNLKEIEIIELKSDLQMKKLVEDDNLGAENRLDRGNTNPQPRPISNTEEIAANVPVSNRFSSLADLVEDSEGGECLGSEADSVNSSNLNSPAPSRPKHHVRRPKGKNIFFESDSNGKEVGWSLSTALSKQSLSDLKVTATTRPGAPLVEVVKNAKKRVKDMSDDDWMVLLGGANQLSECECGMTECMHEIKELGLELKQTNKQLIIVETPRRYNLSDKKTNYRIQKQNVKLKEISDKLGCPYIRLNDYLHREHFTKHGLHLNYRGKEVLADLIMSTIKHSPQPINPSFLTENREEERER